MNPLACPANPPACYWYKTNTNSNGSPCKTVLGGDGHQSCKTYKLKSCDSICLCGQFCPSNRTKKSCDCQLNNFLNPEISSIELIQNKKKTVLEGIDTLKPTIYSDIAFVELFSKTTEEQYKEYFRKLSHSALSLSEQALLLDQMSTDFIDNNALNLFINVQNIASKNKKPVDNKKIKEVINQTMKNVLPNIITSYNYGDDFLKMNYANAYQTMYYATSLYSYENKWPIIRHCYEVYVSKE